MIYVDYFKKTKKLIEFKPVLKQQNVNHKENW